MAVKSIRKGNALVSHYTLDNEADTTQVTPPKVAPLPLPFSKDTIGPSSEGLFPKSREDVQAKIRRESAFTQASDYLGKQPEQKPVPPKQLLPFSYDTLTKAQEVDPLIKQVLGPQSFKEVALDTVRLSNKEEVSDESPELTQPKKTTASNKKTEVKKKNSSSPMASIGPKPILIPPVPTHELQHEEVEEYLSQVTKKTATERSSDYHLDSALFESFADEKKVQELLADFSMAEIARRSKSKKSLHKMLDELLEKIEKHNKLSAKLTYFGKISQMISMFFAAAAFAAIVATAVTVGLSAALSAAFAALSAIMGIPKGVIEVTNGIIKLKTQKLTGESVIMRELRESEQRSIEQFLQNVLTYMKKGYLILEECAKITKAQHKTSMMLTQ